MCKWRWNGNFIVEAMFGEMKILFFYIKNSRTLLVIELMHRVRYWCC